MLYNYEDEDGNYILGGRYKITYDDSLERNKVFVYQDKIFELIAIPNFTYGDVTETYSMVTGALESTLTDMGNVEFRHISEFTEEQINEHKNKLWGYIKIENYGPSDRV